MTMATWFGWNIEIVYDAKSGGILENLPNGQDIYLAARKFKRTSCIQVK
jgi:hypothetical protein